MLALGLLHMGRLPQEVLSLLCPGRYGPAECEQWLFCLPHQRDENLLFASTLAAKAPHDLLQRLVEFLGGALQARVWQGARRADTFKEVQEFF